LGELDGRTPISRAGAQPGDIVAVCGRLGWAAAGVAVLGRGFRSPRVVVDAHRRPEPPYDAGPEAALLGVHAMVDVSDGLLADLGHIARASTVHIDVDPAAFAIDQPLKDVGAAIGVNPLSFILTGGDDNALAGCFSPDVDLPARWRIVGRVAAVEEPVQPVVTVGGAPYEAAPGYTHFT
jgi:thiamine-monophosphate kinase